MLSLFEELFLLSLDEEKGTLLPFAKKTIHIGLAGAILSELALQGRVCSNEKHRLELSDASPTGDEILDEVMREIQAEEKPRKWTYWVSQLSARPKKLREQVGERLTARDVLYQEEKRFFWKQPCPEEVQPPCPRKFEMKNPLRAMVLSSDEGEARHLALLNVISQSELLNLVFTLDELPLARRRIHEMVVRAAMDNPVMQTIEEIEQAISSTLEDSDE